MSVSSNEKVIAANIAVHSRLAAQYQASEPQFRPENVAKVERRFSALVQATAAERLLDLGCGTGFMIDIAKKYVRHITGVDVTQAMLDRVDRSGPTSIELFNHDAGTFAVEPGSYQLVTAYSFLHHLADVGPVLRTASRALAPGGKFYADLDPNFYFWDEIHRLERGGDYHALVSREVESVNFKDEEIEAKFGLSRDVFNHAEFGKNIAGGFKEEALRAELLGAGFTQVEFHYHWFLGEGFLINSGSAPREELFRQAALVHEALARALPISRRLFKYLGLVSNEVKTIAVIGFGALGRQMLGLLRPAGSLGQVLRFDDALHRSGAENSFPFEAFLEPRFADAEFYVALGYRHLPRKAAILRELLAADRNVPSFVHPSCHQAPTSRLGAGCFIFPLCNLDQDTTVAEGVVLHNSVVVSHDASIGAAAYLSPGVVLSGHVSIGAGAFLGAGVVVANHRRIGAGACIGLGTVVASDVPDGASAIGNPLRLLTRPLRLE